MKLGELFEVMMPYQVVIIECEVDSLIGKSVVYKKGCKKDLLIDQEYQKLCELHVNTVLTDNEWGITIIVDDKED